MNERQIRNLEIFKGAVQTMDNADLMAEFGKSRLEKYISYGENCFDFCSKKYEIVYDELYERLQRGNN